MNKDNIIKELNQDGAEQYASYLVALEKEINKKTGKPKNPWIKFKTDKELIALFHRVKKQGLMFDGKHVTLQARGITYDYVAYKNKMLLAYPETKIDVALIYNNDEFNYSKVNGELMYQHIPSDPMNETDNGVTGGYCVIKNKRGEFITTLTKADINKARKVAKTDYIWANWFKEMAMKTVIKKAVKFHFDDLYKDIIDEDNKENDVTQSVNVDLEHKQAIEKITTLDGLKKYYDKHKGTKEVLTLLSNRKAELTK